MIRKLLICGLATGAGGGLLATGFAWLAGEPALGKAVAYEQAHERMEGSVVVQHEALAPVSRGLQRSLGLLSAALVYGLALGGIFALVFAVVYGRFAHAGPRTTACGLAVAAFVVLFLVPFLKYPASPPGASDPSTVGRRTLLYVTMIAVSLLAALVAAWVGPTLARSWDAHLANLGAGLAFVTIVVVAGLALPSVNEVPRDFPATALWRFREASVGMQAVLWMAIGLVFGPVAQRVMSGRPVIPRRVPRRVLAAGN